MTPQRRYVVVGDVHGHLVPLQRLLKEAEVTADTTVVFVGDLIDRGPASAETVRYVADLVSAGMAELVLGNHEFGLLKAWKDAKLEEADATYRQEDYHFLANRGRFWHRLGTGHLVVHGGIVPRMTDLPPAAYAGIHQQDPTVRRAAASLLYTRETQGAFWAQQYDGRFGHILFGHTGHSCVTKYPHATALDTGCGWSADDCGWAPRLSALVLEGEQEREVSVPVE